MQGEKRGWSGSTDGEGQDCADLSQQGPWDSRGRASTGAAGAPVLPGVFWLGQQAWMGSLLSAVSVEGEVPLGKPGIRVHAGEFRLQMALEPFTVDRLENVFWRPRTLWC